MISRTMKRALSWTHTRKNVHNIEMYFFIKLQIVCFLTLLLLIAELVVDHFTHSLTLLVVAWQTLYNFISLFISGVSMALSHNNSRELMKKVNIGYFELFTIFEFRSPIFIAKLLSIFVVWYRVRLDGEEQVLSVRWLAQYFCAPFYSVQLSNHYKQYDTVIISMLCISLVIFVS